MDQIGMSYNEIMHDIELVLKSAEYRKKTDSSYQKALSSGMSEADAAITAQLALMPDIIACVIARNNETILSQIEEVLKNRC